MNSLNYTNFVQQQLTNINPMINLDNLNPDWQFASRHGKASRIGFQSNHEQNGKAQICPCCFQFIYKDPVPLCTNPKQLEDLGFGFPLFYIFLKNCMILLLIAICSYNAMSLKKSFDYTDTVCTATVDNSTSHRLLSTVNRQCTAFMVKISRVQSEVTTQQNILRITSFVIQLLFLIYMRDHITKLNQYYHERNITLSDFSIMLKNIPKQLQIQDKLKQFFLKQFQEPHEIKQITLLPEYPEIQSLKKEREKIINKLRKSYRKDYFQDSDLKNQQNLKKIDAAIQQQIAASVELAQKDEMICQKAILVFDKQHEKQKILQEFTKLKFSSKGPYFGVDAQKITIKQAPQPKQFLWENVNIKYKTKLFLYILGWFISFLILGLATVFFYFMYQEKAAYLTLATQEYLLHPDDQMYQKRYSRAIAIVYGLLVFIILFNKLILAHLYHKITDIERSQTRSKFQFSFGLKYALGLFFTTALLTLIVQALIFQNYYIHPYGVVEQQTVMFFLNAFFVPIYWLVNPLNIYKKIKRKLYYGKKYLTQGQANELMQQSQYDMGKRYAEIIETMWFTFLYSTLIPIGAFISLVGMMLYYWTDKYNLLRRSSLGGLVSGHVVMTSMKLLDFTLLLKPLGELIFDIHIRHQTGFVTTIVMICVACAYLIIPINKLIEIVNPQNFKLAQKTYTEIKHTFKDTYHSQHPILKIIHAHKHKKALEVKGLIFEKKISNISFLSQYSGYQNMQTFSSNKSNPEGFTQSAHRTKKLVR